VKRNIEKNYNYSDIDAIYHEELLMKFLDTAQKMQNCCLDIVKIFSQEYLSSQIREFELYKKKDLYSFDVLSPTKDYNATYNTLNEGMGHGIRTFTKNFKLVNRIMGFYYRYRNFRNDFPNKEFIEQKNDMFDKFFKTYLRNILLSFMEMDSEKIGKRDYSLLVLHNMILNAYLNTSNESSELFLYAKKKRLIKISTKFHDSMNKYCLDNKITIDICQNDKKITDTEKFIEVFNIILTICYTKHYGCVQKIPDIMKSVIQEAPRKLLVNKFEKRFPLYRPFLQSIMNFDRILNVEKNLRSINLMNDYADYLTFEESVEGRKCQENHSKLYNLLAEIIITYKLNNLDCPSVPNSHLWNIFRNSFRSQVSGAENEESKIKTRKQFALNIAGILQKIFNSLSSEKIRIKEQCKVIKDAANDFKNKEISIKINPDLQLENKTFEQKVDLLFYFLENLSSLVVYEDTYPSTTDGYHRLFESLEFSKPFLMVLIQIMDEKSLEKNQELMSSAFNKLLFCLTSYSSNFLKNVTGNRFDCYQENFKLVTKLSNMLNIPEKIDQMDTTFIKNIMNIILSILGDLDLNKIKEKEKVDQIYQNCEEMIYKFGNLKSNLGQNNFIYYLLLVQKLIIYYDEKQVLSRISIELKIKDCFVDKKTCKLHEQITRDVFMDSRSVTSEFALNTQLFNEIFYRICYVTEDGFIKLKEGIGTF